MNHKFIFANGFNSTFKNQKKQNRTEMFVNIVELTGNTTK